VNRRAAAWALATALATSACKRVAPDDELPVGAVPVPSSVSSAAAAPPPAYTQSSPTIPPVSPGPVAAPMSFAPIAKRADPSVVTISTIGEEEEASPFFGRRRRETKGLGTGFVIDKNGLILTNNHVIEGANEITVKLSDDHRFPAKLVGTDPRTDIAVIRIEAKSLPVLALGDSDAIDVGDWVVAIGNPLGLSHTVSAGIISAKGRTRDDSPELGEPSGFYSYLQTDAAINPGNSGGPLLDMKGEAVGMNTAIANPNRTGGAQNIGFAIPINMVKQLLPMLLRDGHVTRSALGVRIRDVRELAPEDRDALKVTSDKGAVIWQVTPDGPADKAGLKPGDVIVEFDGQPVDRGTHLQWLASTAGVGRQVPMHVMRAGQTFELKATLGLLPESPASGRVP
jgi:serine protease Do